VRLISSLLHSLFLTEDCALRTRSLLVAERGVVCKWCDVHRRTNTFTSPDNFGASLPESGHQHIRAA